MKKYKLQLSIITCLVLFGCITEYEPKGIDEVAGILVVEGFITDDETVITLSRSVHLSDEFGFTNAHFVNDARVFVESVDVEGNDGTQWEAEPHNFGWGWWTPRNGRYTINNGKLNPNRKYRLRIEIEEVDKNSEDCFTDSWGMLVCPTKTYVYLSDFSHPIITPEIDSVFWMKRGQGQPVMIHVATHSSDNSVLYYRWSYREDWEINSEIFAQGFPFRCWGTATSRGLLVGSAERTVFGRLTERILEIHPTNRRLSVLYRIIVTQNAISKRAHDYFENIKKNSQLTGSIFSPIPSELRGNIVCINDTGRPVIGFVEVSTTTQRRLYIYRHDGAYERPYSNCYVRSTVDMLDRYGTIPLNYVSLGPGAWALHICVDCTFFGTEQRPDDWPR